MTTPIDFNELVIMENRLKDNANFLLKNKLRFMPQDYNQLMMYQTNSIGLLNKLKYNTDLPRLRQESNPPTYDPYKSGAWERQFDKQVENPPMYSLAPMNVWTLPPQSVKGYTPPSACSAGQNRQNWKLQ